MIAMEKKKQPGRFTLQFNMEDPQQKKVSDFLEQQGRHKAQFITSAVLQYMQYAIPEPINGELSSIDKDTLIQMMVSFMEKHPRITPVSSNELIRPVKPSAKTSASTREWDSSIGDDTMKAISETLAAFQQ